MTEREKLIADLIDHAEAAEAVASNPVIGTTATSWRKLASDLRAAIAALKP